MRPLEFVKHLSLLGSLWLSCAARPIIALAAPLDEAPLTKVASLSQLNATDYRGKTWQLPEFKDKPVLVIAFLGVECPLAKLYAKRLDKLAAELADKGVAIIGVDANPQDSLSEMAAFARRQEIELPLLRDAQQEVLTALGATRTPEVFVLDAQRKVRYHGRVDDQYGVGYARKEPTVQLLRSAIENVLAGQPVVVAHEPAVGCLIGKIKREDAADKSAITYSKDIAPIFRDACVSCHRPGEIGPFPMTDYAEIAGWAEMIAEVVSERRMPPWHANPEFGKFANDCSLSDAQRDLVMKWVAAGAPEGNAADLPAPRQYLEGWQLERAPDLVLNVSKEPISIRATGELKYRYFEVDPGFTEDKWIKAAQVLPGNRQVVHHILVFTRDKAKNDRNFQGERGFLFGYVPGAIAQPYPAGAAKRLPANHTLLFQVHYTPIGTEQTDQSKIGMIFVDESQVTHEVITTSAVQTNLDIPPQEANYTVSAKMPERLAEGELLGLAPHMHLRGKSFRYTLTGADKSQSVLLEIPHYDFNWQTAYRFAKPIKLSAGSRIECEATFDNSTANLNNPDPSARVRWGDQTDDEMMIGYFDVLVPKGQPALVTDSSDQRRQLLRQIKRAGLVKRLDKNEDGQLQRSEVPDNLKNQFDLLDIDHNQTISADELQEPAAE